VISLSNKDPSKATAGLPVNKGKPKEAEQGVAKNMIWAAYDTRTDEIKLKAVPATQIGDAAFFLFGKSSCNSCRNSSSPSQRYYTVQI
jgi:hypothetical protein